MSKKCYYFICEGFTSNGSKISPVSIAGYGETKEEAKKDAKERFKKSKHADRVTRCESK